MEILIIIIIVLATSLVSVIGIGIDQGGELLYKEMYCWGTDRGLTYGVARYYSHPYFKSIKWFEYSNFERVKNHPNYIGFKKRAINTLKDGR